MSRITYCAVTLLVLCFNLPLAQAQNNAELAEQIRALQRDSRDSKEAQRQLQERVTATREDLQRTTTRVAQEAGNISALKSRSDDEQKRLSEAQARIAAQEAGLKTQDRRISTVEDNSGQNTVHIDRFWLLIAAALVFLMQAGFKCFEVGMVRRQHADTTAMKNLLDWLILSVCYFLVGFGIMYGKSFEGIFGTNLFAPTMETMQAANPKFGLEFFLFQLAFAGTAATIVSGAMAERTGLFAYSIVALFAGAVVYPLIGHWAWGTDFHAPNHLSGIPTGWLKKLGFIDFAGSTVVHSVGAWISLVAIWFLGPRLTRFVPEGKVNTTKYAGHNLSYSTLGVLLLWFGWWGFNGGSQLRYDLNVSSIILNTNIAASVGGLTAFALAAARQQQDTYEKLLGGVLGGLVAVTACCNIISSIQAIAVGVSAGLIHNIAYDLLLRLKLKKRFDDPVGAIPVHGACGVWGTLCVAIFGDLGKADRLHQLGIQLLGIVCVFVTVTFLSILFFFVLDRWLGLRVSDAEEEEGFVVGKTKA